MIICGGGGVHPSPPHPSVTMQFTFIFLFAVLLKNLSLTTSCNLEDLRTCTNDAVEQMNQLTESDATYRRNQCRDLRANMDCMQLQSSACLGEISHHPTTDLITKSWKYLDRYCKIYGNWSASTCFRRNDVKRCESLLPLHLLSPLDSESCRMFSNFRACVESIVDRTCSLSDRMMLGTYFIEKGQQLAWRCPRETPAENMDRSSPLMYADEPSLFCLASKETIKCKEDFETIRTESLSKKDEDKNSQICCSYKILQECVAKVCGPETKLENLPGYDMLKVTIDCEKYSCNGAKGLTASNVAAVFLLLYFMQCLNMMF